MQRKAKRKREGANEHRVDAQHQLRTLHQRRVPKRIKRTKGVKREYDKERKIVTVKRREKNKLFARRTRSTSCAGCALRKSSL